MKILITNTVVLNGGDAAILFGLKKTLHEAFGEDLDMTVYDAQPDVARRYYPEFRFRRLLYGRVTQLQKINRFPVRYIRHALRLSTQWLNPIRFRLALRLWRKGHPRVAQALLTREEFSDLQTYGEADLIVSTGGTYLNDVYDLDHTLFDYEVALALGRPLVFFTQTMGTFARPEYRDPFRAVFNEARLILLRDDASLRNLRALGVRRTPMHVCADAAFALAEPPVLEAARERPLPLGARMKVAVSVRQWPHFQKTTEEAGMQGYRQAIRTATIHLVEQHGAEVTFLSTCQGIPEYHYDDAQVALEIVQELPARVKEHVRVDRRFHHPLKLHRRLRDYDWVLATRMHMAILALVAGTPVLPISYEFKTKELFARLDMEHWVHDIETLEGDALRRSVDAFIAALPAVRSMLFPEKIEREYRQARSTAALLNEALTTGIKRLR